MTVGLCLPDYPGTNKGTKGLHCCLCSLVHLSVILGQRLTLLGHEKKLPCLVTLGVSVPIMKREHSCCEWGPPFLTYQTSPSVAHLSTHKFIPSNDPQDKTECLLGTKCSSSPSGRSVSEKSVTHCGLYLSAVPVRFIIPRFVSRLRVSHRWVSPSLPYAKL